MEISHEMEKPMKSPWKRILPILLVIVILCSVAWYLFVYDRDFTRDMLLKGARYAEETGHRNVATWLYTQAYRQSGNDETVAIELANQYLADGNYTKAEYTLSRAISNGGTAQLYIALCKVYIEQDKLLDAVAMLDGVTDAEIKAELDALRPAAPTATPAAGFYSQYITVTLEGEGEIYYTTNSEYPSLEDDGYTEPITMSLGENTIYALAVGDNGLVSPLAIYGYTIGGVIEQITLADEAMDARIREILGYSEEDTLYTSDLWTIESLSMDGDYSDWSVLSHFTGLKSLTITGASAEQLSYLSSLTTLEELSITDSTLDSTVLSAISSFPSLTRLTLSSCALSSLSGLEGATGLVYLDLTSNTVRDITALSGMTELTELYMSSNALTDLSALSSLDKLEILNVSYNSIATLDPLAECESLTYLDASHNAIGVLSGVDSLEALVTLDVSYNSLTDVDAAASIASLERLLFSNNTVLDISSLSALENLHDLDFSYNEIETLPAFAADSGLQWIDGSYNLITDLEPLRGLNELNQVIMNYNEGITSVEALAECHNLILVEINGCPVEDVSMLTEQGIIVHYNPIVDVE